MAAAILVTPELAITPAESKSLSEAIKQVGQFYPMALDPRKMAIANLAIVAAGIYGTRAIAINARTKRNRTAVPGDEGPKLVRPAAPPAPTVHTASNPRDLWPQNGVLTDSAVGTI